MSQEKSECLYYDCQRKPLGSSKEGYCIFHTKAEDKSEGEFKKALEKRIEEADYDFRGFVFIGDVDFKKDFGVLVFKNASFVRASFQKVVSFAGVSFQGEANFERVSFQGAANFIAVSFQGGANFFAASFHRTVNFGAASFQGAVNFWVASFQGAAYFSGTSFHKVARFVEVPFQGEANFVAASFYREANFGSVSFYRLANFGGASFQGDAYFGGVSFQGEANFEGASFHRDAAFVRAEFRTRASISPRFTKGEVLFIHASLENIYLTPLNLDKGARIDFSGARLRNTEIRRKDIECHIMQEREEHFSEAKEIYLLLKNNFHSLGRYDDESWAFRKEKEMERRSFWHFRKEYKERELGGKWTNKGVKFCFYAALLDFEYPAKYLQDHWFPTSRKKTKRLLSYMVNFLQDPIASVKGEFKNFASFVVKNKQNKIGNFSRKELSRVLWFYMKYPMKCFWSTFLKYLYEWGEWPWLIFFWCAVTIFIFSVLYLRWDIIAKDGTLARSYLDKLYFSGVTFTTLGYGDYSPVGGARFLAFIESFLGVFLIALFIFSFARRTAGR